MSVFRIYVEKKSEFAVEANQLLSALKLSLRLENLESVRILNRYDAENISKENFELAIPIVFSEPVVDTIYTDLSMIGRYDFVFAVEYLPGQFDQRADSCEQCIQILTQGDRPIIKSAKLYALNGELSAEDIVKIKKYLINPVESREAKLDTYETLNVHYSIPDKVEVLDGFIYSNDYDLANFIEKYRLAMDLDDIKFCQKYFRDTENRNPTITEIRMIDTYWSDHCRHTTFSTIIDKVDIKSDYILDSYNKYLQTRNELYVGKDKPVTLMDLAVIGAKKLKKDGVLDALDESEEINACSVKIKVDVDGQDEDWLLMFKNETHNHPTEIEPFGGAATCLGGAIRDPLSGRSYVYQAMRVTGAANPLVPEEDTMPGKLSQRKITTGAASGYSSYGNQIGLATGLVHEIYHPGYIAKRMEIGAVIGAAPQENVVRTQPEAGDMVILLGGKTGRDGCGGATGSSKSHTSDSLESCGAEVQKGNAPEERKIQRLFRNDKVTKMIKRCNDFGAGGVSVAIGELADGLAINLDTVPKKYEGLDGTELAISESQERMAVVVDRNDVSAFIDYAVEENLEATVVAVVTAEPRLKMKWNDEIIVDLSREFLNSNGADKHTDILINEPIFEHFILPENSKESWTELVTNLNICSQKGLAERFDSTIGAGSVLMPFGGKNQLTPTQAMVSKIPVLKGETSTCSVMSWGFNPLISEKSPYHGAMYAVVESVAKVIAGGGNLSECWLTFQEYFERTKNDPVRWGKPLSALLGAFEAQLELGCAAIGGKDSMSGTFENIDVPPTLVSFAVSTLKSELAISPEFKSVGSTVIYIKPDYDINKLPIFSSVKEVFAKVQKLIKEGLAKSIWTITNGGVAEGIAKMSFGNSIGFKFDKSLTASELFKPCYGGFIIELDKNVTTTEQILGTTIDEYEIVEPNYTVDLKEIETQWLSKLEPVFPCNAKFDDVEIESYAFSPISQPAPAIKVAKPRVVIPVFPGTNCEYDTARAFERAGAIPEIVVINNLTPKGLEESIVKIENFINNSQIVMLPGGFSGGDEPDGSGKFITTFFRNPKLKDAIHNLLENRDGLMLGICNGFQALIKLGLVPFGRITDLTENSPTLTYNTIGRHQSMMVNTRIASTLSPWLNGLNVGDVHNIAISHGEGRFVVSDELLKQMAINGQIATQYVDNLGNPTSDIKFNPNNSIAAIEGITSPDGRVFGKMGHSERIGKDIGKNVPGNKKQHIFENGVRYFS